MSRRWVTSLGVLWAGIAVLLSMLHFYLIDVAGADAIAHAHQEVLSGHAPAPVQYRIGPYCVVDVLARAFRNLPVGAGLVRAVCWWLTAMALLRLYALDFPQVMAALGAQIWLGMLPFTFVNYRYHPEDAMLAMVIALGLWAARVGRTGAAGIAFGLGGLCHELSVLAALGAAAQLPGAGRERLVRAAACILPPVVVLGFLAAAYRLPLRYSPWWMLPANLTDGQGLLLLALTIGPAALAIAINRPAVPSVWRRPAVVIPLWIGAILTTGVVRETRLIISLLIFVVPSILSASIETEETCHPNRR